MALGGEANTQDEKIKLYEYLKKDFGITQNKEEIVVEKNDN